MQMKQHLGDGRTTRKKEPEFLLMSSHHTSPETLHWTIPQSNNKCLFCWSHCVCMWSLRGLTCIPPNTASKWQSLDLNCGCYPSYIISPLPCKKFLLNYVFLGWYWLLESLEVDEGPSVTSVQDLSINISCLASFLGTFSVSILISPFPFDLIIMYNTSYFICHIKYTTLIFF